MLLDICAVLIAYLFGSISSAIIVCKLMRLPDPRTQGSNNPGATNVLRIGGKKAAIITLLGDVLKGVIPVLAARYLNLEPLIIALVMFAAFFGHLYPIFFCFEGGKGVATIVGCLLAFNLYVGLAFLGTWILMAALFRYSSLSSLTSAILAPLYVWYFSGSTAAYLTTMVMSLLLIYRHRTNIGRLFRGEESKIGKKKS
jgi:glycerol-3-phosphate acyltransferase PlsY